ncbi:MAG: Endonuclease, partial [uncultured Blastococcus sp.]
VHDLRTRRPRRADRRRLPDRLRTAVARPQLALPRGGARHRGARGRRPRLLRGEDPAGRRLRPPRGGGYAGQATSTAHAGAPLAGRPRRARARPAVRRRRCAGAAGPPGTGHPPAGGVPV